MKKFVRHLIVATGLIVLAIASQPIIADFKSTFLIQRDKYSTLSWLSDEKNNHWREVVAEKLNANQDTHADIMARSTASDFGLVNGVNRDSWRARYKMLIDKGISPVTWMISDDSGDVYARGLADQMKYQREVVAAVEDLNSHYVVCLECDEYYTSADVSLLISDLRRVTKKPIGVHLTPGMRGKEAYIKDADLVYLQVGFDKSMQQIKQEIEYAVSLGKPVVVSEYHLNGQSAEAKAIGDYACTFKGVVGTGNGRGSKSVCESYIIEQETKKEPWYDEYSGELAAIAWALAFISASEYFKSTLPFQANMNYADEDGAFEVMLHREITQDSRAGVTVRQNGRIMGFISGSWDRLKLGATTTTNRKERK
jgi:hypothetical protein